MRLFLWPHNAQELREDGLTDQPAPISSAVERREPPPAALFGWWTAASLLDEHGPEQVARLAQRADSEHVVASAGSLSGGPASESDPDAPARALLRMNTGEGMARLLEAVSSLRDPLEMAGSRLCLRPRAADVLSDLPSCLTFLRSPAAAAARLVLDPMALLTPSMLERADDHLERILGTLGGHPQVAALMLTNAGPDGAGRPFTPIGLHREEGVVDSRRLIALAAAHAGPGVDWILLDEEPARQIELLRMYGPGV